VQSFAARCLLSVLASCAVASAHAQGEVDILCSVPLNWCEATASAFLRETGIKVNLTQKGAGEALTQLTAERGKPRHDVWYGGASDSHRRAAAIGLNARSFYDCALQPAAQKIGADTRNFEMPSNRSTPVPPNAPAMRDIRLIPYDFAAYGNPVARRRLLDRWDREVGGFAQ
jgi:ABC-type Fe3+ transport system substrate-binding protein